MKTAIQSNHEPTRIKSETLIVGVDARCLNKHYVRGMGKYLSSVIAHTPASAEIHWRLFSDRPDLPVHTPDAERCGFDLFEVRGDRFRFWEQFGLPTRVRRLGMDVLHSCATTLPWWQPVPTVVTVHDTLQLTDDTEEGRLGWFYRNLVARAYQKCAAIITISENSRADIARLWPSLSRKMHVIPHGIDNEYAMTQPAPLDDELKQAGIRSPYFVYLGGEIPRKRMEWSLQVFAQLDDTIQLVVCGIDQARQEHVLASMNEALRRRVCLAPFIPERLMPRLYQNACGILYPTMYEGFGLPVVEASAVGTPVVFSAVGSLTELQGPGGIVLPPHDLDAWVGACRRLVDERGDSPQPHAKAREWSRRFSWEESARRHVEVYRLAAATGKR